ncbi:MAG TPA: histidine phosphatase family protein [Candidatus Saccharimonadales bacterium]|nr:histidine phosphatase family protein [Candidatus Saccharimonadales bacterium]
MKTIYFVRHGESESNVAGIVSGGGNDIHLTATGRDQAKKAGQDLKGKGIELIVCSPMIRTVETATIIAKEIGYKPEDIVTNLLFVERAYGIYEGRPSEIFQEHLQNNTVHDSVETTEQIYERLGKALDWLREQKQNTILVVSHGGAGRAVRAINQNLHHSHMYKLEAFKNAEIYEFKL